MLCTCISVSNKRIAGYIPALSLSWCMICMPELHVRKKVQHYPVVYCIVCAASQCICGKFTLLFHPPWINLWCKLSNQEKSKKSYNDIAFVFPSVILCFKVKEYFTSDIDIASSLTMYKIINFLTVLTIFYNPLCEILQSGNIRIDFIAWKIKVFQI